MLLIIDGHKTHLNLIVFLLNGIAVLGLPAHSNHLLQMFDVAVAAPLKTAFIQELDRRIPAIARKAAGNRDDAQRLRRVLVKSFLNELRKGVAPGNIMIDFRQRA
jgi:hypothetical protein